VTQNIYDDPTFFDAYSRLERSVHGLDGAPEWPALRALLPDMSGLRVLDLGCGYGWFCRWARQSGARHVLGIDVSERMLQRARDFDSDEQVVYRRADLEDVELPEAAFDLVYSSLAFHYVTKLPELVSRIHTALVPGGRLVFSVEHPIVTASRSADWLRNAQDGPAWPVDHYFDEGPRATNWLVECVVKQHRMLGTYFSMLRRTGFMVSHLEDWGPSEEQVAARPDWAAERERPLFLLVTCDRPIPEGT
jgi:SAM-dependent methyltransferase